MRKFFTVIARLIASIFAILFVITTILALLLTTLNQQIFSSKLGKTHPFLVRGVLLTQRFEV